MDGRLQTVVRLEMGPTQALKESWEKEMETLIFARSRIQNTKSSP